MDSNMMMPLTEEDRAICAQCAHFGERLVAESGASVVIVTAHYAGGSVLVSQVSREGTPGRPLKTAAFITPKIVVRAVLMASAMGFAVGAFTFWAAAWIGGLQ